MAVCRMIFGVVIRLENMLCLSFSEIDIIFAKAGFDIRY